MDDHKALTIAAPKVWAKLYGNPREHDPERLRRRQQPRGGGAPRPGTLKAWKLQRRREVTNAVEEARASGALAADAPAPLVNAQMGH